MQTRETDRLCSVPFITRFTTGIHTQLKFAWKDTSKVKDYPIGANSRNFITMHSETEASHFMDCYTRSIKRSVTFESGVVV